MDVRDPPKADNKISLRMHRPGDMGFIAHRHGYLYFEQYGWDERFESLVCRITADFIDNHNPVNERCWIAELIGRFGGCVMLVRDEQRVATAKLRLLLVEPTVRGSGVGMRLLQECIQFAIESGYQKIVLWTQSVLIPARRLYEKAGFQIVHKEDHESFGHKLTAETWELDLSTSKML